MSSVKLQLMFVCVLGVLVSQAQERSKPASITYKGIILESGSLQAIAGATITNRTSRQQAQSDENGRFELAVQGGDTLLLSHVGYEMRMLPLPAIISESASSVFILSAKSRLLPSVTVRQNLSGAEFQRDFAKRDIPIQAPVRFWDSSSYVRIMNSVSGSAGEAALMRSRTDVPRGGYVPQVTLFNFFELRKLLRKKKKSRH
jgi:hypothetical protein